MTAASAAGSSAAKRSVFSTVYFAESLGAWVSDGAEHPASATRQQSAATKERECLVVIVLL